MKRSPSPAPNPGPILLTLPGQGHSRPSIVQRKQPSGDGFDSNQEELSSSLGPRDGPDDEEYTREKHVRASKTDPSFKVLVTNPGAARE